MVDKQSKICSQPDCGGHVLAHAVCALHYRKQYYRRNKAKHNMQMHAWRAKDPNRAKQMVAASVAKKPQQYQDYRKAWSQANKGKVNSKTARRRAKRHQATPPWLNKQDMKVITSFYSDAAELELHVDHILPIQGTSFSGLHVPWNLQMLTPHSNKVKSNSLPPHGQQLAVNPKTA